MYPFEFWFSLDICPGVGLLEYVHDKICLSFLLVGHLIASSNWSTFLGLFLEGEQEGSPSQGPKGLLRNGHSRISLSPLCKWQELWKAECQGQQVHRMERKGRVRMGPRKHVSSVSYERHGA